MTDVATVTYRAVDPVDEGHEFMSFLKLPNGEKTGLHVSTVYFLGKSSETSQNKARDFWNAERAKEARVAEAVRKAAKASVKSRKSKIKKENN